MTGEQARWLLCTPIGAKVRGIVRARGGAGRPLRIYCSHPSNGDGVWAGMETGGGEQYPESRHLLKVKLTNLILDWE